jgi:HlyD family secretion protein
VARATLEQARAARDKAQTERQFADSDLKRQRELDQAGLVSAEKLETAIAEAQTKADALRAAESAVRRAQRELELAQATLVSAGGTTRSQPIVMRAPVTGMVLKRLRESEAVVPAGEPLVEIGDPKNLEIVSDLLSTDAVRVSAGSTVLIDGWGGAETLEGRVRRIEPSGFTKISALGVEEQRVNVIIDFDHPAVDRKGLGDGYRVEVRIVVWAKENVVKVPISGLFREGEHWAAYAVKDNRAVRQAVTIGQRNSLEAEVLSGVTEGQQIIVHPSDSVDDGVRVRPRS